VLQRLSQRLSRVEQVAAGSCALLITVLIVFNVVTRAMNQSVFWVDEAAVLIMVWMLFLSMAVLIKQRQAVSVTVLVDHLPPSARRAIGVFIDLCVLLFALLLLAFSWKWYAPFDLARHDFDVAAFSAETMNFMYQERASTLPLHKFWIWLIVPYFASSVALHTLANLWADPFGRHMDNTSGSAK
jgi:C4-dicarboxylate transporter, DctQ subunit